MSHDESDQEVRGLDRRTVLLRGSGALGMVVLGGFLQACGGDEDAAPATTRPDDTTAPATTRPDGTTAPATTPTSQPTQSFPELEGTTRVLRATDVSWLWAPYLIANRLNLFDEGFDQEPIVTGSGDTASILVAGDGEVALASTNGVFSAQIANQDVRCFAGIGNTYALDVVITAEAWERAGLTDASTTAERAAALKGLKMGTTGPGAANDLLLRYIATNEGNLNPESDFSLIAVQGGGSALLAAVEAGQLDGFANSAPTSSTGVASLGMKFLFNMGEDPVPGLVGYMLVFATASGRFLDEQPDHAAAYCRGLQRALDFINGNPEEFRDLMWEMTQESGLEIDEETFQLSYESNGSTYPDTLLITEEHFNQNREFYLSGLEVQGRDMPEEGQLVFEKAFDARAATTALEQLSA